jgi:hypothetical protein
MAKIFDLLVKKLSRLDSIPKKFLTDVEKAQYEILDKILQKLSTLTLDKEGKIVMSTANLKRAEDITDSLQEVFLRSDYIEAVTDFASAFDVQKQVTNKYFESAFPEFKDIDTEFADAVFQASKRNAVESLATSTVTTRFLEPLKQQIDQIVTSGMDFKEAVKSIRQYAIGDGEKAGKLLQYSKQIAYDSIATADRAYTSTIADELESEWFYYAGGLIPTSREFCIDRNGKYYHYREVESWANENWQGKAENTNSANIYELLGGYNCNHSLIPVSIDQVPQSVVIRNKRNGNYEPTQFDEQNLVSLQENEQD